MFRYIIAFIIFVITLLTSWLGVSKKGIRGGFMAITDMPTVQNVIPGIVAGTIDYHNVRNLLAQNIHEEVICANAGSASKNVIWDPVNNLSKSCTHNKKLISEDYKLTYKLRDLITTTYVRSLDNPFTYKPIEPKLFAIKLLDTFNQGISLFIREYSKIRRLNPDDIKIIYKGGNVIATHSRIMYDKFGKFSKGLHNIIITKKMSELNRGDWDYTLYINSTDQRLISSARTFVLYMLSEIKKYLDTHKVFNMKNIADKLFVELYNRNDVKNILTDYRNMTNKTIAIEQLHVPGFTISGGKVTPTADPQIHSQYSFNRDSSIVDSFQVNSLIDPAIQMGTSINSIGFTEGLSFRKTHLVTDFDLARVKINNEVRFNIDGQKIDKMLSADIIDMSFINAGNTLDKYVHYKLSKIGAKEWVMRNVNGMIVPYLTPHYLFYDLCSIIIETSVYPWDDKKYGKRLDRLINMGILSAVTIYGSARLKPYIYFVLQRINELRGLDPETAFKLISTYTTIDDDLTFNVRTNYFTFEILKSIVKSVIYMYFVSNVSIGGNISNVSTNVAKFVNKNLAFIFEGKSEITRDMFMKNADINQYHVYVDSVYTKLDLYHDLFNKIPDIVITENESISHDKI